MQRFFMVQMLLLVGLQVVAAQFNGFFENMFGGHHQHQQQQQQQQQRSGASQWAAYSDGVACSQYMCPETLDCVPRPSDCPCPNAEDIKCNIPDADGEGSTFVCTRGPNDCREVERLMRKESSFLDTSLS
ncbi:unnamed protein product [Cyclocybe aegerita]|uniref:Long chronological lifespan protein 2 n=1 Tax=Cyclocybe aegerita TaxID=1973307 RepID=A0A8S0W701_CYCAE|nr:unnamed protein product [Cyclocybe aegerita]